MKRTLHLIEGNNAARVRKPVARNPVDGRIRDFLAGNNNGSELLAALYGHVGREPIPDRLRIAALLAPNHECVPAVARLA
jgi:hypothetical protein